MKRLIPAAALVAVALVGAAGCASSCASHGWEFRVFKPATFNTPGLVQSTNGPLAVSPLGSTIPPVLTGTAATPGAVRLMPMQQPLESAPMPRALAPVRECTCEELLAALQRIDSKLAVIGAAKMPNRPEEE